MRVSAPLGLLLLLLPVNVGHVEGLGTDPNRTIAVDLRGLVTAPPSDFLDVDEAFVLTVEQAGARTLTARFAIAPGYYLYRDKMSFTVTGNEKGLGSYALPPGKRKRDDYFGETEVYYHRAEVRLPLDPPSTMPATLRLQATYQGCAEERFCYPPVTREFTVEFGGSRGLRVAPSQPLADHPRARP